MKKHKYQEKVSELDCNCPPDHKLTEKEIDAYRWVHSDLENENNFRPVLEIDPNRIDELENCESKCKGYGISLFNSLNNAERKLTKFLKRKPLLVNTFGNCIAEGKIAKEDGKCSEFERNGHFTLHEHESCNLKPKFTIVKELKEW